LRTVRDRGKKEQITDADGVLLVKVIFLKL
jgi:hypothetical protein